MPRFGGIGGGGVGGGGMLPGGPPLLGGGDGMHVGPGHPFFADRWVGVFEEGGAVSINVQMKITHPFPLSS